MNLFEAVKAVISTKQAAERYGIEVKRNGMACCPFHQDRTPSMKLDERFHCVGCGADGDVIDFTARLFGLGKKAAAERLAQDFSIPYDGRAPPRKEICRRSDSQRYKETEQHCFRVLADYLHLLQKWAVEYAPGSLEDPWIPQFTEALQKQSLVENILDLLYDARIEERAAWIAAHGKEVIKLERRISELTAGAEGSCHGGFGNHESSEDCKGSQEASYQG